MTSLKFILVVFSLNLLAHAEKESLENLDQLLDDPAIWQYIEKRVQQDQKTQDHQSIDDESLSPRSHFPFGDEDPQIPSHSSDAKDVPENPPFQETRHEKFPYFRDESKTDKFPHYLHKTISDSSGNSCSYRQNSSLIIRSKTSLENGAAFLRNANHLSAEECARKCCYTQNCNLAVYEDKDEHSCYLFDCGSPSKCLFAPHANYTLLSFHETNNRLNEGGQSGHHENELENLGKTPQPQTTTTPTPAPKMAQVALYGECDIDWRQSCADQNAECRDSQCKCKDDYHAIYAYCRRLCDSDEFQCKNKGLDNKVPDCIDRKHWCDGVPQCADGSDEESCPKISKADQIGNKDRTKVSPILPSNSNIGTNGKIPEPAPINQVLLPNTDRFPKLSNNQYYSQGQGKTGVNNFYDNPMIPQNLQEYYWPPQQQGLLNNQGYPPSYSDYPQFQGQPIGQGYLNNLGYSGQKYGTPYNGDRGSVNSGYLGGYPQNQNLPFNKFPLNQGSDVNNDNFDYHKSVKLPYDSFNDYQNPDSNLRKPPTERKNITGVKDDHNLPDHTSTTTSTSTTTTTATTTTTTETTTTSIVMTTSQPNVNQDSAANDMYYPNWSGSDSRYYQDTDRKNKEKNNNENQPMSSDSRNHDQYQQMSPDSESHGQYQQNFLDSRNRGRYQQKSDSKNHGRHQQMSQKSRNHDHYQLVPQNSNGDEGKNWKHYKSKADAPLEDNYHQRYPYRFRQKGKYPDYDSRMSYNWPEYYDDRSDYPDFHQQYPKPGQKPSFYDTVMDGDHKDESAVKDENDQINLKTPSPLPPAVPKEEETHDESDQEKHSETENVLNLQNENVDKQSEDVKPTLAVTKSTSPVTSTPKAPVPKTTLKHVDLEAPEKVVIESPTDSNQGPIVALALGLGICLMLLIFVGCRLRTVKRRIRRGKSLHSNEADYLINGMYL